MNSDTTYKSAAFKQRIGLTVHRCNLLIDEIRAIFLLEETMSSMWEVELKQAERAPKFLIITKSKQGASELLSHWLEKEITGEYEIMTSKNLLIISVDDFTEEFGKMDDLCDQVIAGQLVYDSNGLQTINKHIN